MFNTKASLCVDKHLAFTVSYGRAHIIFANIWYMYISSIFCFIFASMLKLRLNLVCPVCTDGAGGSPYGNGGSPYSHEGPSPVNGAFPISTATGMTEMLQVCSNLILIIFTKNSSEFTACL